MTDPLIPILHRVADELARREAPPEVVPLGVGELPERRPYLPAIWLDAGGRPTPVLAYSFDGRIEARLASVANGVGGVEDIVVYPESAAPALWDRFLARQAGRV